MSYEKITWEQSYRDACERAAKAALERDIQYRWTIEIARLLGVPTETDHTVVAHQYSEIRARITAGLTRLHDLMVRHNALMEKIEMIDSESKAQFRARLVELGVEINPTTQIQP